jgi:hypothetical protein
VADNYTPSQRDDALTPELKDLEPSSDSAQHDSVKAGKALPKLLEGAVKGKVFKKVEIHGTA